MPQEQIGLKRISEFGFMAAFGLITMSSSITDNLSITTNKKPINFSNSPVYVYNEQSLFNSSMLSEKAIGDIILHDNVSSVEHTQKSINVNLHITKIRKHISHFDFEEEFEEI